MVVFQSTGQNLILVKILWSKDLRVEHIFLVRVSLGAKSVLQQAAISLVCDVIVCSLFLAATPQPQQTLVSWSNTFSQACNER